MDHTNMYVADADWVHHDANELVIADERKRYARMLKVKF